MCRKPTEQLAESICGATCEFFRTKTWYEAFYFSLAKTFSTITNEQTVPMHCEEPNVFDQDHCKYKQKVTWRRNLVVIDISPEIIAK